MFRLKGLVAAPFTPLDSNGDLDLKTIEDLIDLYIKNEISGAFIAGTTGEGVSLTFQEKKQLMKAWGEKKGNSLKVLFMLGGNCQREMIELAHLAQSYQMDGISILPPFYFKAKSCEDLVDYCKSIADEAANLPFYYYHIPGLTGVNFQMYDFLNIADGKIGNLAGIKYSSLNVMDFQNCINFRNKKYNILWGVDEALLSGLVVGAEGAVGSTYNYAAPLYNRLIKYFKKGNIEGAKELQYKAVRMVDLLIKYGGTGAGKAFMKIIGLDCGEFRPPVQNLDDSEVDALRNDLSKEGFFDYSSQF